MDRVVLEMHLVVAAGTMGPKKETTKDRMDRQGLRCKAGKAKEARPIPLVRQRGECTSSNGLSGVTNASGGGGRDHEAEARNHER